MSTLSELMETLPQQGQVKWIGVRPARKEPVVLVDTVEAVLDRGLTGDRYKGVGGKRQVTLVQWEHLAVMGSMLGYEQPVEPALLRRNIAVSGINLLALKGKRFQIGEAIFEYTGLCHPCSRMEEIFGPGGYNAIRGHGGINARVLASGIINIDDKVMVIGDTD